MIRATYKSCFQASLTTLRRSKVGQSFIWSNGRQPTYPSCQVSCAVSGQCCATRHEEWTGSCTEATEREISAYHQWRGEIIITFVDNNNNFIGQSHIHMKTDINNKPRMVIKNKNWKKLIMKLLLTFSVINKTNRKKNFKFECKQFWITKLPWSVVIWWIILTAEIDCVVV